MAPLIMLFAEAVRRPFDERKISRSPIPAREGFTAFRASFACKARADEKKMTTQIRNADAKPSVGRMVAIGRFSMTRRE